jgi:hypothetical protein
MAMNWQGNLERVWFKGRKGIGLQHAWISLFNSTWFNVE